MRIALLLGLLTPLIAWADASCYSAADRSTKILDVKVKTNRYGVKYQVLYFASAVSIPDYGVTSPGVPYDNSVENFPGINTDNCTDGASLAVVAGSPTQLVFACHIDSVGNDFVYLGELYCLE